MAPELFPPEMRERMTDWRKLTADRAAGIRADYLLAVNRVADARAMIVDVLPKLEGGDARQAYERQRWQRRLGDVEATEGRVSEALAAYQASLLERRNSRSIMPTFRRLSPRSSGTTSHTAEPRRIGRSGRWRARSRCR
jgi:hypothetical protein